MPEVVAVDPFRCRMWRGHERLEECINAESCKDEIESFLRHGQRAPVLGRRLSDDATHDFELVYGARRLFVARHLNVALSVEVRELTDHGAVIALDIENRQRKELSPYERGRAYRMWIQNGIVASQDDLAQTLNISASQVSRLIKLAELPCELVSAFPSPVDICEAWGRVLMDLWSDPTTRPALRAAAQAIVNEKQSRPPVAVFKRLIAAAGEVHRASLVKVGDARDEVIKDDSGRPLFRVRQHRADTALLLPTSAMSSRVLAEIKREVAGILHRARAQVSDSRRVGPFALLERPHPALMHREKSAS
jgi:ParB family transcriptional regulator, chromosome partitioning protein